MQLNLLLMIFKSLLFLWQNNLKYIDREAKNMIRLHKKNEFK